MTGPPALRAQRVRFVYPESDVPVLDIAELVISAGECVLLRGPSGAGKTTLLGLLAGLATPSAGEVWVGDTAISQLGRAARDRFRADHIGLIFQLFNLVPYLSVLQNVRLAADLSSQRARQAASRAGSADDEAKRLLGDLGISGDLLHRFPEQLSVGQQQRVAAARAFMGAPPVIIADEPTSALDRASAERFVSALLALGQKSGATVIVASHDDAIAPAFTRVVDLDRINEVRRCA